MGEGAGNGKVARWRGGEGGQEATKSVFYAASDADIRVRMVHGLVVHANEAEPVLHRNRAFLK